MDLSVVLKSLSDADTLSYVTDATVKAGSVLSKYCSVKNFNDGSILGFIDNKKDQTVLFDAHIDQIGMIVTEVFPSGFLKVSNVGGVDERILAGMPVNIYGKRKINGVFCNTPPHLLKKDEGNTAKKITEIYIDTGLSDLREVIAKGDIVTFRVEAELLEGEVLTGKSLDNRAGVTALLRAAELLSEAQNLKYNVAFLFSIGEELGLRGAKLKAFNMQIDRAVAVDVSFGNCPGVDSGKTAVLGSGGMIGISPVLSKTVTEDLINSAKVNDIKFTKESMGGTTSTNADELSLVKSGIPSGLVSIPLRNMHTPVEVVNLSDIEAAAQILAGFVKE